MITSSPALFKKTGPRKCTWRISVRGNKRIKLWFDALQMDGDTILVRDGNESSASLLATVKDGFRSRPILSKGNSMYIFYNHNGKWRNGTKRGFTASYRAQGTVCESDLPLARRVNQVFSGNPYFAKEIHATFISTW